MTKICDTIAVERIYSQLGHNFEKLKAHILGLSEADNFSEAMQEWSQAEILLLNEWDNCPCGKSIKELCFLKNSENGASTYVGNVCVRKFSDIDNTNLIAGLKRIAACDTANANEAVIDYAHERGFLYDGERGFLMNTRFKKNPSPKVTDWKRKINRRITESIKVQR